MQLLVGSSKDSLNAEFKTMIEKKSHTNHLVEKLKVGVIDRVIEGVSSIDENVSKEKLNSDAESLASDGGLKNPLKAALKHLNKR